MSVKPNGEPAGPCPLEQTDVKAEISGFLSRVTVTQEFENPYPEKIEAIYTFPLSRRAAVDGMTMQIGDRTVLGKIARREEARAIYESARDRDMPPRCSIRSVPISSRSRWPISAPARR